jgi:DNA-binding XRE family transcriptional regulator
VRERLLVAAQEGGRVDNGVGGGTVTPITADDSAYVELVGGRVRLLRLSLRWSQKQLAEAAGLSRVFVSAVERGRHAPNLLALRHLAAALGVPLADLIAEDTGEPPVDLVPARSAAGGRR